VLPAAAHPSEAATTMTMTSAAARRRRTQWTRRTDRATIAVAAAWEKERGKEKGEKEGKEEKEEKLKRCHPNASVAAVGGDDGGDGGDGGDPEEIGTRGHQKAGSSSTMKEGDSGGSVMLTRASPQDEKETAIVSLLALIDETTARAISDTVSLASKTSLDSKESSSTAT